MASIEGIRLQTTHCFSVLSLVAKRNESEDLILTENEKQCLDFILQEDYNENFELSASISLKECAIYVLKHTPNLTEKAELTLRICKKFKRKGINCISDVENDRSRDLKPPNAPSRVIADHSDGDGEASRKVDLKKMLKKITIEATIHGIANAEGPYYYK